MYACVSGCLSGLAPMSDQPGQVSHIDATESSQSVCVVFNPVNADLMPLNESKNSV